MTCSHDHLPDERNRIISSENEPRVIRPEVLNDTKEQVVRPSRPNRRLIVLAAVVVIGVATGLGVVAWAGGFASSQEGLNPVADFTKTTPAPFYVTTPVFPDYSHP